MADTTWLTLPILPLPESDQCVCAAEMDFIDSNPAGLSEN